MQTRGRRASWAPPRLGGSGPRLLLARGSRTGSSGPLPPDPCMLEPCVSRTTVAEGWEAAAQVVVGLVRPADVVRVRQGGHGLRAAGACITSTRRVSWVCAPRWQAVPHALLQPMPAAAPRFAARITSWLHRAPTGQILGEGLPSRRAIMAAQSTSFSAGNSGSWRMSSPMMQPAAQQSTACVRICVRPSVCADSARGMPGDPPPLPRGRSKGVTPERHTGWIGCIQSAIQSTAAGVRVCVGGALCHLGVAGRSQQQLGCAVPQRHHPRRHGLPGRRRKVPA